MRDRLRNMFIGRQGMDELSKALFWAGLVLLLVSVLLGSLINTGALSELFSSFGIVMLVYAFFRAFSKNIQKRELENSAFLAWLDRKRKERQEKKERYAQRDTYKFFKCPGCGTMIRVPAGKGKIHIKCRCGYTLYRKT